MKLFKILAPLLALLILAGCASGAEQSSNVNNNQNSGKETVPTTVPATQPTQEKVVTVDCLISIVASNGVEERTGTIRYEADGIHIVPDVLLDDFETIVSPDGRILCLLRHNEEGVLYQRIEYKYNDKGQQTEYLYYYLDEDRLGHGNIYEYNEAGLLVRVLTYYSSSDTAKPTTEYSYDENGNLILTSHTNTEGLNNWRYVYTYDDQGRMKTATTYFLQNSDKPHVQLGYYTYYYDESGLLVKKIWTDVTKLYFVHNDFYYSYNEADLLTEIKEVDKRGNVDELVTYTYDEQNRLISMSDVEDDYYYATTYIYGQIELPESLAEDAKVWSETGLINYDVIDAG